MDPQKANNSSGASSTVAAPALSKAVISALQKFDQGNHYDGAQMAATLVNRCISRGQHEEAVDHCRRFSAKAIDHHQFGLAADLGILLIKVYEEFELAVTKGRVQLIFDTFCYNPETQEFSSELSSEPEGSASTTAAECATDQSRRRLLFIEKAVKWVAGSEEGAEYLPSLHLAAGKACLAAEQYGQAQGHLVLSGNVEALGLLIKRWQRAGYPSEADLIILRLIFLLIVKGHLDVAKKVLRLPELGFDFDSPSLPPPIQLTYLMVEFCQVKNLDFFDTLQTKYSLVIRRDPAIGKLMQIIEETVGNRKSKRNGGILDLMSGLFAAPRPE